MQQIIDMAHLLGWMAYHTHDSRRSEPGWPDLVLVKGTRLVVAEIKAEKGVLTPAQECWLSALRACTAVETYVWRPKDVERAKRILQGEE